VSSIDKQSPAPFSGIGDAPRVGFELTIADGLVIVGGFGIVVGLEIFGAGFDVGLDGDGIDFEIVGGGGGAGMRTSIGGAIGTSTQSEP
jgi:hypothetical protein